MNKKCFFCQETETKLTLDNWIEEKQYSGSLRTKEDYQKNYTGSVYYCSWKCFNLQLDKEEKADWAKGDCVQCQRPIVVVNDKCQGLKHKQEAHYLAIDCLRKEGGEND